jgi:hypothetical protein
LPGSPEIFAFRRFIFYNLPGDLFMGCSHKTLFKVTEVSMDGQTEMISRPTPRDLLGGMALACSLTWVFVGGCSGTAGDEGTVNLIAAQEAELKNPLLAEKAAKFSGSLSVAPGRKPHPRAR